MICEAILKIKSDAQVSVSGDNIDTCIIEWHDGNPTNITKDQIKAKINETAYQRNRKSEYPTIQEQLDLQYHDAINGTTKWKDKIKSIKDKYPKPSEE
jgi:hypothetical protein